MDPITPITPGLPSRSAPPVERLRPISRERDRPARERPQTPKREPQPTHEDGEQDGRLIDVRV